MRVHVRGSLVLHSHSLPAGDGRMYICVLPGECQSETCFHRERQSDRPRLGDEGDTYKGGYIYLYKRVENLQIGGS